MFLYNVYYNRIANTAKTELQNHKIYQCVHQFN